MYLNRSTYNSHVFCTNSAFYYFDVLPNSGTIGNYSRVSVVQIGSTVTVSMQGIFFYGQDANTSRGWFSAVGFPNDAAIGIDAKCIPPMRGHPLIVPDFVDEYACTTATTSTILFPPGGMPAYALQPPSILSPPTVQFLDGQSGPVACVAHLPDPGVNVVYRRTSFNPEWFFVSTTWVPYGWNVDFTYSTDSTDWSVPGRCKTSFRDRCTLNP